VKRILVVLTFAAAVVAQTPESPSVFYGRLAENAAEPRPGEALSHADQLQHLKREEVVQLLPAILASLSSPNPKAASAAALALYSIEQRTDASDLLGPRTDQIGTLLASPDSRLQNAGVQILGLLKSPRSQACLLNYVRSPNSDPKAQAGAIFYLVRNAPSKPDVVAAVLDFVRRPLSPETKVIVVNSLGTPIVKEPALRNIVFSALEDSQDQVRFAAIQSVRRMGPDAIREAQPTLERIVKKPDESTDVRKEAKDALLSVASAPHVP